MPYEPLSKESVQSSTSHKPNFRELFPFTHIRVTRRTRSKVETRPPVPRNNAVKCTQLTQDLKNLKYTQIQKELLDKDCGKENLHREHRPFYQSVKEIAQEELSLHEELVRQLAALQDIETILEDNFRLAHLPPPLGAKTTVSPTKSLQKAAVSQCSTCGLRVIPCIPPTDEYQCGVCHSHKSHPVSPRTHIAIELLLHSESRVSPKPPSSKETSIGAITERPRINATSIRRRNFTPSGSSGTMTIHVGNQIVTLAPNEREYVYLHTGETDVKKEPAPITPSFSAQSRFLFGAEDCGRRVVTEENAPITETSETDCSHFHTDFSMICDKSELEISFSEPENGYFQELFELQPSKKSVLMVGKDLDTVLQKQVNGGTDIVALVEEYGRHIRSAIRALIGNPLSAVIEKTYKGLVLALDVCLQEQIRLSSEVKSGLERETELSERLKERVKEANWVQQMQSKGEAKWQQRVEALSRQLEKYEEQMDLYRKELGNV